MIDMLGRKKNRTVKKALDSDKLDSGPTRCPQCGKLAASVHYRTNAGLVCRTCREQVRTFGLPG